MDLELTDKVALITGGSSGIGLATARLLAREGARVCICGRDEERLLTAALEIKEVTGREIIHHRADVTQSEEIARLVENVGSQFGRIDVLVNNVGSGVYKPFLETTEADLRRMMDINFFSHFLVTQRVLPVMLNHKQGSIVNIAGASGVTILEPPFNSSCTAPAKAAVVRFTKTLAAEVGESNIRVNCVAPSFVVVPERLERWRESMGAANLSNEELQATWGSRISLPGHRWCTVDEAARAIAFVASPAASYITGAVLVVDGGLSRN